jgi:hypothetical protein
MWVVMWVLRARFAVKESAERGWVWAHVSQGGPRFVDGFGCSGQALLKAQNGGGGLQREDAIVVTMPLVLAGMKPR